MSDVAAPPAVMRRVLTLYAVLIPANIAAWVWAFVLLHDRPVLLGTAALAYVLACGMRLMPTTSLRSTTSPAS
jgi:high-affinity nickel permease